MSKSWKPLIAGVVLAGGLSSGAIADGYEYEPVGKGFAPPRVFSWTGFYVGINAGGSWGNSSSNLKLDDVNSNWSNEAPAFTQAVTNLWSDELKPSGFTGGGQIGYNFAMSGLIVGVEGDFNYLDADDSRQTGQIQVPNFAPTYAFTNTVSTDWWATIRGRLGVVVAKDTLLFATAGVAFAEVEGSTSIFSATTGFSKAGSGSSTLTGYTVGGGGEFALARHWSLKVEYLYTDLGDFSFDTRYRTGSTFPGYSETVTQDLEFSTVRGGLNYRF